VQPAGDGVLRGECGEIGLSWAGVSFLVIENENVPQVPLGYPWKGVNATVDCVLRRWSQQDSGQSITIPSADLPWQEKNQITLVGYRRGKYAVTVGRVRPVADVDLQMILEELRSVAFRTYRGDSVCAVVGEERSPRRMRVIGPRNA
jgi:hypothetical protein